MCIPMLIVHVSMKTYLSYYEIFIVSRPFILQYSLSYACLKFVNYSFFFWLPLYLTSAYGWSPATADEISIWYDVGGIVGKWHNTPVITMNTTELRRGTGQIVCNFLFK